MKVNKIITVSTAAIVLAAVIAVISCGQADQSSVSGTLNISGAWALYPLAMKWKSEYMKTHTEVKIEISAGGAGKGMTDVMAGKVDLAMVSRDVFPEESAQGAVGLAVARDAVLPTISAFNPFFTEISKTGATRQELEEVWRGKKPVSWEQLIGKSGNSEIQVYTRSDACGAGQVWAQYLHGNQEDLGGIGIYGDPGIADKVKTDKAGIGYNNIGYIYNPETKRPYDGLAVFPIDLNENGVIDKDEDVYGSQEDLLAAIQSGKLPSPPVRKLYFVYNTRSRTELATDFLKWVITVGTKYVEATGYVVLSEKELAECLNLLQ
ncbi:MAG: extracellular solute-binding protein [Spirochaetaceae bacterium]|nr:MAG: extracellular solute-binding protein [Spirochaetaceae bacterium]